MRPAGKPISPFMILLRDVIGSGILGGAHHSKYWQLRAVVSNYAPRWEADLAVHDPTQRCCWQRNTRSCTLLQVLAAQSGGE